MIKSRFVSSANSRFRYEKKTSLNMAFSWKMLHFTGFMCVLLSFFFISLDVCKARHQEKVSHQESEKACR